MTTNVIPFERDDPEYVMVCVRCQCRTFEVQCIAGDLPRLFCAQCGVGTYDAEKGELYEWFRYVYPEPDAPKMGRTTSVKVFSTDVFPLFWRQMEKAEVAFAAIAMQDGSVRTWRSRRPEGAQRGWLRSRMKEMLAMLLAN